MLANLEPMGFIPTIDADRARKFYVDTLGLEFLSDDPFALVVRANGIDLRIVRMGSFSPAPYTIFGWKVSSLDEAVGSLVATGITFERYPFLEQDVSGIWTAPGGSAKVAWFKDPDGNILSLSQHS
jgi:catechol 2,3-dioxygenase-like lactoylglutathione lyase family enzyme